MKSTARETAKAVYARPALQVFGSVRNLTGGSQNFMNDGGGSQTQVLN
jgi:hypothetical protein